MHFLHTIRMRVLTVLLALALASWIAISLIALPAWPVVGVAIITAAAAVNQLTAKLGTAVCGGCGKDLAGTGLGAYGMECPHCGRLNAPPPVQTVEQDVGDPPGPPAA